MRKFLISLPLLCVLAAVIIISDSKQETSVRYTDKKLGPVFDFLNALSHEWKPHFDVVIVPCSSGAAKSLNSSTATAAANWTTTTDEVENLLLASCPSIAISLCSNPASDDSKMQFQRSEQSHDVYVFENMDKEAFTQMLAIELNRLLLPHNGASTSNPSLAAPIYIFFASSESEFLESNGSAQNLSEALINRVRDQFSKNLTSTAGATSNLERVLSLNSNVYILATSPKASGQGTNWNWNWTLFEMYALSEEEKEKTKVEVEVKVNPIGHGRDLSSFGNKVATRSNLGGVTIRATAPEGNMTQGEVNWTPANSSTESPRLSHGFGVDIFKCLQHALHFHWVSVPTKGWASLEPAPTTGNVPARSRWAVGMAQEVVEGRADIALAKTSILPYRAASLSYLVPIHALILTAFFRQPSISTERDILLLPFEPQLWAVLVGTWLLLLGSMKLVAELRERFLDDPGTATARQVRAWNPPILWCFAAICQQGWHSAPRPTQLRLILVLGLFLGLLSFVAYSATMVSLFTVTPNPINSFEQLLRSSLQITIDVDNSVALTLSQPITAKVAGGSVGLVSDNSTTTPAAAATATSLLIQKVGSGGNSSLLQAPEAQARLLARPAAFLTFPDKFYTTIKSSTGGGPCGAAAADDRFLCSEISSFSVTSIPFRSGLFVAKGSPYKELFNAKILLVFTSGLMRRYVADYEATYTPICTSHGRRRLSKQYVGAGVNDLYSAYLILVVGLAGGTVLLILERSGHRIHHLRVVQFKHTYT